LAHTPQALLGVQPRRSRVEAAGTGCFAIVHRDNVFDAIRVVRERPVDALVVSVHQCRPEQVEEIAQFVRRFPSVPAVAFVSHHDARATEMLLRLGASGVRQVVDVTGPAGWTRLRQLVSEPVSRSADARLFVEVLVRLAPDTATVRQLSARLGIRPSTLMSRFARAGLPSPKSYLAAMRLLHAAQMLEDGGLSIADVAHRLDYSSPQSFGRHVRSLLGITSSEFRKRFPFPLALRRFIDLMIRPYAAVWAGFHPLERSGQPTTAPGATERRDSPR
jgi:AraC-like DNA-binding protein